MDRICPGSLSTTRQNPLTRSRKSNHCSAYNRHSPRQVQYVSTGVWAEDETRDPLLGAPENGGEETKGPPSEVENSGIIFDPGTISTIAVRAAGMDAGQP